MGGEGEGEAPPPEYAPPPYAPEEAQQGEADPSAPPPAQDAPVDRFAVGTTHRVEGLQNLAFLNGKVATVNGPAINSKDGLRYPCLIENKAYNLRTDNMEFLAPAPQAPVPQAAIPSAGGQAANPYVQGAKVRIRGLVQMQHLNGQIGRITGLPKQTADGQRYPVMVGTQMINFKPDNMTLVTDEGAPAGGAVVVQPNQSAPISASIRRWGDYPTKMTCVHCNQVGTTYLRYEPGVLTYLSCFGIVCVAGFFCCCCLIPFCVDDCKDAYHHCPNCKRVVGKHERM